MGCKHKPKQLRNLGTRTALHAINDEPFKEKKRQTSNFVSFRGSERAVLPSDVRGEREACRARGVKSRSSVMLRDVCMRVWIARGTVLINVLVCVAVVLNWIEVYGRQSPFKYRKVGCAEAPGKCGVAFREPWALDVSELLEIHDRSFEEP